MTINELATICGFEVMTKKHQNAPVLNGYTSDLLSDVMGHAPEAALIITIQAHKNTVAVASLVNASGILICHEREVPEDMLEAAEQEGIAILRTQTGQFETSHQVFQNLFR